MDLHWLTANMAQADEFQARVQRLLARLLVFPAATVAAGGHMAAAGCMFALACDARVMLREKSLMFVPGVDLGLVYSEGMTSLMVAKLPTALRSDFICFARRLNAEELVAHGVVRRVAAAADLAPAALEVARELGKHAHTPKVRETLGAIKGRLYAPTVAALQQYSASSGMGFGTGQWDARGRAKL